MTLQDVLLHDIVSNLDLVFRRIEQLEAAPTAIGGGGVLVVHTHANAAQGGQLDWDDVWSDAVHDHTNAAEGGTIDHANLANVTSDQHHALIHTHANAGEGGQLDWDDIWSDAVHDHSVAGEGGEIPLASLGGYTQGDIIYGGAADWQDLVHPGAANRVLQSAAAEVAWSANAVTFPAAGAVPVGSGANTRVAYWTAANTLAGDAGMTYNAATDSLTAGDYFTTDGGQFGIAGNELLTVNAAGTFGFSGITGITVEDNDWIGLGAAAGRIEFDNQAPDEINILSARLGLGTSTPDTIFHIEQSGTVEQKLHNAADAIGNVFISGYLQNAAPAEVLFAQIGIDNAGSRVAASETGTLKFSVRDGGAFATRMVILGGNVGVNTVTPRDRVDILDTTTQLRLTHTDNTDYATFAVDGNGLLTLTTVDGGGAAGHIVLMPDGLTGIGIAAPVRNLHIHEGDSTQSVLIFTNTTTGVTAGDGFQIGITDAESALLLNLENTAMSFGTNGNIEMTIEADGDIGFGTTTPDNPFELLSSSAPQFRITHTDATDYCTIGVDGDGKTTITTVDGGGAAGHLILAPDGSVGIKEATPLVPVHITHTSATNLFDLTNEQTVLIEDDNCVLQMVGDADSEAMVHIVMSATIDAATQHNWVISHRGPDASNVFSIGYLLSNGAWGVATDTEYLIITTDGDVGVGSIVPPTANSGKILFFGDNTADPTMDTNTAGLYAKDVSGTVEMFAIDEADNETQLTPHTFALFEPDQSYTYPWSYYGRNSYLGIEINVDMYGAIRALEELTGGKFIFERDVPRREWTKNRPMPQWMAERVNQ